MCNLLTFALLPAIARLPQFQVMRTLTWLISLYFLFSLSTATVIAQSTGATASLSSTLPLSPTAQLTPALRFDHLTAEDGLAQNTVNTILQDRQGFLWFGTNDGLSRFDGYDFVTYKSNPQDPNSLAGNQINALLEDGDGMIWIVSDEGGVSRFDPLHERFLNLSSEPDTPPFLIGAHLFSLYQDHKGIFWFGGDPRMGLIRYDVQNRQFTQLRRKLGVDPNPPKEQGIFPPGAVKQIRQDAAGRLWLLTETTVAIYEDANQQITTYYIDRAYPAEKRLNTLLLDEAGQVWIGGTLGLYRFEASDGTFHLLPNSPSDVTQLYRDGQQRTWIGASSGLYPFDPATETIDPPFQHNPNWPNSLSQNQIRSLYQDRAGLLWIGTANGGVDRLDLRQARFRTFQYDPLHPELLADDTVAAFSSNEGDFLWLAAGPVLEQINRRTGAVKQFQPPPDSNGPSPIRSLLQDHAGQLWLGMAGRRLLHFDPATQRFREQPLLLLPEPVHPGPSPEVAALYEDQAHNLWVVVSWDGLYQLNAARQTAHTYRRSDRPELFLDDSHNIGAADIMAITGDDNGGLWLGYASGNLSHYDAKQDSFHHYVARIDSTRPNALPPPCAECPPPPAGSSGKPPPQPAPLARTDMTTTTMQVELGGWVESLLLDSQQILWVATRNGLIRFDPTSKQSKWYGEQEGLPTSYVVGILEDEAGTLWLSTKKGLSHFDPSTQRFRNYDLSDGLQGNEFLSRAALRAPDGELTFGGINGFTTFNPSQIMQDDSQLPVVLTGLRLFNLPVAVGEKSLLTQAIWATNELTLGPDPSILSFEFASLSYRAAQKNRYRYQLAGLENSWNEVDSRRRFATYSSLPAGNYTLRVQASNADGVWSNQEVKLALKVLPPWWRTTWLRLAALLTLLGGAYAGYSYRVRAIQQRNRQLETAVVERTQSLAEQTQALTESEARLLGLAASTFEAIFVHNQGQIVDANHAASELFGYEREDLLHRQLHELLPTLQLTLGEEKQGRADEIEGWTAEQQRIPLEMRHRQIPYQGNTATVVTLRDLSERKEIESQKQQVAAFQERERIGRDLHDNLGQIMGYLSVQAQTVRTLLDQAKAEQGRTALNQLVEAANHAHEEIRSYILDIRKPALAQTYSDFVTILRRFLQQTEARHGLAVSLSLPNEFPADLLSLEAEDQLLRIIQEAINNIQKHANVQQARLIFTLHPDELQVIISDEGQGFQMRNRDPLADDQDSDNSPPATRHSPPLADAQGSDTPLAIRHPHHFGLDIMRERAESIGGSLELRSQPGAGTQIIVRLPRRLHRSNEVMLPNLRVMLVDDHPLYLQGLRNLLSARGVKVVGTANDGQSAIALARKLLPDLILMDVEMPICNGIEATRTIKNELPEIKVVMLTVAATEEILLDALKFGASGYLLKNLDADQFFSLLRDVMRGEMVLSPQLAARVLVSFAQNTPTAQPILSPQPNIPNTEPAKETAPTLTFRQQEVLEFITQGMSNKEIAKRLDISEHTVKYHVGIILETLQLRSRYELAQYARSSMNSSGKGG